MRITCGGVYGSSDPKLVVDRLAGLRAVGPEGIERLLERIPALADAFVGRGTLARRQLGRPRPIQTFDELARLLGSESGIRVALLHTTTIERQLLALAVWHGDKLDRAKAQAESGAEPAVLDRAADGLADLLLSDPSIAWVAPRPGVADQVSMPLPLFRRSADSYTSADLGTILGNLGVHAGTRKWERLEALESALRDEAVIRRVRSTLDPTESSIFDGMLDANTGRIRLDEVMQAVPGYQAFGALQGLASTGLIGYDPYSRRAWPWLDVAVTVAGIGLFEDWSEAPEPQAAAAADGVVPSMPGAVAALDRLMAQFSASPPVALKTGGIGVKSIRSMAKVLGEDQAAIGLLTVLAGELGLIGPVITATRGRGRNRVVDEEWRPTDSAKEWTVDPATSRWRRLVVAWLDSNSLPAEGSAVTRYDPSTFEWMASMVRGVFARELASFEAGHVVDRDAFEAWLVDRYPALLTGDVVSQLLAEARVLGLVAGDDHFSITPVAVALFNGEDLDTVLDGGQTTFVVQADHSIIAPPDLDPDVAARLERFAELHSDAGARQYRIEERGVISALDGGMEVEEILSFLDEHVPTGVPQNVARTIEDAASRHGRLQLGAAATWIASEDPALISAAIGVKAAKLTAISPTAAVSTQPRSKVMQALRTAGLAALDTEADEATASVAPRRLRSDSIDREELFPVDLSSLVSNLAHDRGPAKEADWQTELRDAFEVEWEAM